MAAAVTHTMLVGRRRSQRGWGADAGRNSSRRGEPSTFAPSTTTLHSKLQSWALRALLGTWWDSCFFQDGKQLFCWCC